MTAVERILSCYAVYIDSKKCVGMFLRLCHSNAWDLGGRKLTRHDPAIWHHNKEHLTSTEAGIIGSESGLCRPSSDCLRFLEKLQHRITSSSPKNHTFQQTAPTQPVLAMHTTCHLTCGPETLDFVAILRCISIDSASQTKKNNSPHPRLMHHYQ